MISWGVPLFSPLSLNSLGHFWGEFPGAVSIPGYVLLCPYSLWASFLQKEDAHPHEVWLGGLVIGCQMRGRRLASRPMALW